MARKTVKAVCIGSTERSKLNDNFTELYATPGANTTATAAEITRACDVSARIVNLTAASLALTEALHDGKIVTVNKADGSALTLPVASGSGARFHIIIGTTVTSNSVTIKVASSSGVMVGLATLAADGGDTSVMFETAADSDTITFNGTTTGGYAGASVELIDIAANTWYVRVLSAATGAEATPFSATV